MISFAKSTSRSTRLCAAVAIGLLEVSLVVQLSVSRARWRCHAYRNGLDPHRSAV